MKVNLQDQFLSEYNNIIKTTIARSNEDIYKHLTEFFKQNNLEQKMYNSNVPTCLVVTSSESASSIET
jgi:hypothetical protein